MFALLWLAMTCLLGVGAAEDDSMDCEARVREAIGSYQPAWRPAADELSGIVVVIDPARGGTAAERRADELSLLTGEQLFHMVRHAGGVPVLTRADDQPMPGSETGLLGALRNHCACAKAHLLLRIEFGHDAAARSRPATSTDPLIDKYLAVLREAAGGSCSFLPEMSLPAIRIAFEAPPAAADPIADRLFERDLAQRSYRGLAQFVTAHRESIEERRSANWADVAAEHCRPVPLYPNPTKQQKREAAVRQIAPGGHITPQQAGWFCQLYARLSLSNRTQIYFEPEARVDGDAVVLSGGTTDNQLTEGMLHALRTAGIENVRKEMRVLPDAAVLGEHLFGACRVTMARTFAKPAESAGPQTQLLYGEPLFLLDRREGHYLIQGSDGYWGWVREEAVAPMTRAQFAAYTAGQTAVLLEDLEVDGSVLRAGTRLPVAKTNVQASDLRKPHGGVIRVAKEAARVVDGTDDAQRRVRAALDMLYIPYVYGARSPIGMDCSGLVANVADQTGMATARDAAQQFLSGKLVATRWHRDGIRTGDQLFFIDESGKVFHTGIALTPTHFIHASPPEVQISSLKRGDRLYNAHWDETFVAAKRP